MQYCAMLVGVATGNLRDKILNAHPYRQPHHRPLLLLRRHRSILMKYSFNVMARVVHLTPYVGLVMLNTL